jgi:hypothetical protein
MFCGMGWIRIGEGMIDIEDTGQRRRAPAHAGDHRRTHTRELGITGG